MTYLSIRKSQTQDINQNKLTWNSLEDMKVNDLRGYLDRNFNPEEIIAQEDDEDQFYLKEYSLQPRVHDVQARKERSIRSLRSYGSVQNLNNVLRGRGDRSSRETSVNRGRGNLPTNSSVTKSYSHLQRRRAADINHMTENKRKATLALLNSKNSHRKKPRSRTAITSGKNVN